jgi:hypothetical protein
MHGPRPVTDRSPASRFPNDSPPQPHYSVRPTRPRYRPLYRPRCPQLIGLVTMLQLSGKCLRTHPWCGTNITKIAATSLESSQTTNQNRHTCTPSHVRTHTHANPHTRIHTPTRTHKKEKIIIIKHLEGVKFLHEGGLVVSGSISKDL